jgi:hypothetical protein
MIETLDPAGYAPLVITKGISIQGHGYSSIFQTCSGCVAITISVTTSDPVTLNGLFLDGGGTGTYGILITSGLSVQIFNSVVRNFTNADIRDQTSINGTNLLIEDTIASDSPNEGIVIFPLGGGSVNATLSRVTANNNAVGILSGSSSNTTIANLVISNGGSGLQCNSGCTAWLAKTVISGNVSGVVTIGGIVNSYGDNYIRDNVTPVSGGSLTPVMTQ